MAGFQIPQYTQQRDLPSAPNALPSVRQTAAPSAAQLGGNARSPNDYIGAGLRSAGEDFARVGAVMQEREDARVLFERETLLKNDLRQRQADWSTRKGANAIGVTDEVAKYYDEASSKYGDGLNPRQREIFAQVVERHRGHSLDSYSAHEARERSASLEESAQASIVGSVNFAVDNAENPDAISTAAADIDSRVQVMGQLNGWSHERTQIERQNYQSKMHAQVIARLADTDPDAAAEYLDTHADSIDPVVVTKLRKATEAATATARAQGFADEVMAAGMSEADALAEARKRFSGEDEQRAVAEIKTRHTEIGAARERAQRAAADEAYAHLARGGINSVPPSLWSQMDGRDQLNMREFAEKRAERVANRHSKDPAVREATREQERISYQRLREQAEENPEAFANVDLVAEGAGLADSDYNRLRTVQEEIRKGTYKSAADVAWKGAIADLGIGGSKDSALKERTKLRNAYDAEVARFRDDRGREPTQAERAELIDGLVMSGSVPGMIWGTNEVRRYEAVNAGKAGEFTPNASADRAPAAAGRSANPVTVINKAEAEALPKGTRFVYNGKEYTR